MKAKIGGFLHLAVGEEATIVGATSVMRDEDYLISTYREHGQALARGTDPKVVMAELFGKETGTSRGRGGSMHLFDLERRFMGGYGIVGGNLPLAAGLALASDYKGEDSVTVCMFGDGASNQGTFGETMNIAALWKLPVVFLVVNNQYGMGTALVAPLRRHRPLAEGRVPRRAGRARRRHGRARRARVRRRAPAPGARGPPADAGRGAHLPLPRPLRRRPRGLPDQGGGAAVARARPDRGLREAAAGGRPRRREGLRGARPQGDRAGRRGGRSSRTRARRRALESLYDNVYVLGDQVQGWYSVDERTPEVHRGEDEPRGRQERRRAGAGRGRRRVRGRGRRAAGAAARGRRTKPADAGPGRTTTTSRRRTADGGRCATARRSTRRCARRCARTSPSS